MSDRSAASGPLAGRSALVTGGSRGIGRAICVALAGAGAAVGFCHAGDEAGAAGTLDALAAPSVEAGGKAGGDPDGRPSGDARAWDADVSVEASVVALFDRFEARFGVPDIVVSNAGILLAAPLVDTPAEAFDAVIAVNLRGTFLVAREAARRMRAVPPGHASGRASERPSARPAGPRRIVNIASELARTGRAEHHAYCASKGGILSLTRSLARELAPDILVNAIAPGPIATDMTDPGRTDEATRALDLASPLARYGEPRDVAAMALFLAGDGARFVTGQCFGVDGGSAMA